jgi:hypothetical protein
MNQSPMALQNSETEDHRNPLKVAETSGWVGRKEDVILFEKIKQDCCLYLGTSQLMAKRH